MPPLERKTFRRMGDGELPEKVGFVKVRVGENPAPIEHIVFKATLERDSSLRHEAENTRLPDKGSRYYADAGFINVTPDGLVVLDGRPEEVLDVPVMTWEENLAVERRSTIALVQKIAGRRIPVKGNLPPRLP